VGGQLSLIAPRPTAPALAGFLVEPGLPETEAPAARHATVKPLDNLGDSPP